jgi:periodic tryptophan protein 2
MVPTWQLGVEIPKSKVLLLFVISNRLILISFYIHNAVWDTNTGFSFVTFTEHTSTVTGVAFTQTGRALLSSSLDGTVRAFDMARYRNFRTFTSPKPAQFSCLSIDVSGDLVAAGAQDTFDVYLWSLQTGRLLEVLRYTIFP